MVEKTVPEWTKYLWDLSLIENPRVRFKELDLTNKCNLNCSWCNSRAIRNQDIKEMSYTMFTSEVDDAIKNHQGILLTGGGEPTLYSRFEDAIIYLSRVKPVGLGLMSNGVLWTKIEMFLHAMDFNQNVWVRISQNDRPLTNNLLYLAEGYGKLIGWNLVWSTLQQLADCTENAAILEGYDTRFVNMRKAMDMDKEPSLFRPEECKGRLFDRIVEPDGTLAYCCQARGLNGRPPKACPKGCRWEHIRLEDALNYNPNT